MLPKPKPPVEEDAFVPTERIPADAPFKTITIQMDIASYNQLCSFRDTIIKHRIASRKRYHSKMKEQGKDTCHKSGSFQPLAWNILSTF